MRFRVLGTVEVHDGDRWHAINAAKPRSLLAALLIRVGDVVGVDQLLFELWGDRPPRSAPTQIHGYVLRIRRALGETGAQSLVTVAPGYRLVATADDVDALVFAQRVEQGQAALRAGDAERAAGLLRAALAMWRGPALADVAPTPLVTGAVQRLTEIRLAAWEARADADLALGRHAELIDELEPHVAAHPLREAPWRQLMLALDRAGRRSEALAAYERLRRILDEHSGIEPGPELRRLHDELRSPAPHQLPAAPRFVGRAAELARLDALAALVTGTAPVVAALTGPAGIGKTALARHWARLVADRFPDGQLYADLGGFADGPPSAPGAVLTDFLHALGVPDVPADEDARGALYRSRLAGRRVLIVLDNAGGAEQVRPLLPGPAAAMVLVTSRDDLRGLTATHNAHTLRVPVLDAAAAVALLGSAGEDDDMAELAQLCGRVPLALRIAAAKLAARTPVAGLVSALRDGDRLSVVRAAHEVSYAALPEAARRTFRLLGLVPGPDVAVATVAALAELPEPAAAAVLDRLAATNMVEPCGPGRFRLPDLLRDYARDLAASTDSTAARHRLAHHYLASAMGAARYVSPNTAWAPGPPLRPVEPPDTAAALAWLDAERVNLVASVGIAPGGWRLVDVLRGYFSVRLAREDWEAAAKAGLAAAEAEDSVVGRAAMCVSLGHLEWCAGRYRDALRHSRAAVSWARRAGWRAGEATALSGLGRAVLDLGGPRRALTVLAEALRIDRAIGYLAGEARDLHVMGLAHQALGNLADAVAHQRRALALYEEVGDDRGRCVSAESLAWVARQAGEPMPEPNAGIPGLDYADPGVLRTIAALHNDADRFADAHGYADRAVALARVAGEHRVRVEALNVLGAALAGLGRCERAAECYAEALSTTDESGFVAGRIGALLGLAAVRVRQGRHAEGVRLAEQGLATARARRLRVLEGQALTVLASATAGLGRHREATRHAELALTTHRDIGHLRGETRTRHLLDELRAHAG